jgi:hypothetical protein
MENEKCRMKNEKKKVRALLFYILHSTFYIFPIDPVATLKKKRDRKAVAGALVLTHFPASKLWLENEKCRMKNVE